MQRPCDVCGAPYEAQRRTSMYCSKRCSMRASRAGMTSPGGAGNSRVRAPLGDGGAMVEAVRLELERLGQLRSVYGAMAVRSAERLGSGLDSGGGTAALSKELGRLLAEAAGGAVGVDRLDELRDRRRRKLAKVGGGDG